MSKPTYDLLIKNVRVVRPHGNAVHESDIAIKDGKFAKVAPAIDVTLAKTVHDGRGRLAFPGVVDAHMHSGIYSPLEEDAVSESKAAAMGGVTSSLNYFRTGQYYLNKGGPYKKFYPEVLKTSKGRFHVDYGYHLAPMDSVHNGEVEMLIEKFGVASFKIFMFYGSHGLHGASNSQREFLMIGENDRYDYAHFEFVMRAIQAAREKMPERAAQISLSLHCETAEIMTAYTKLVEKDKSMKGLAAYSAARPQHSEGLAVFIASYLAHETALPNINLLHLSSRKAVEAALMMAGVFPHIDFRREVTIGHLMLDINSPAAELAKVNPPIRPREDVEFMWQALLAGELDWVASDHACCRHETKIPKRYFGNIWMAKSGFGGTEYLLPALVSEGTRRGMSYNHMAQVTSWNAAQRYGLNRKGDIAEGYDADIAIVDPARTWTISSRTSPSTQGYTPFEGLELSARVEETFLRGSLIYQDGNVIGKPQGEYLFRRRREIMKQDSPQVVRSARMPDDTQQIAVAIVGAGACGLTAALILADAGIECVVLERDASPSGSTALSSGFIPAAGTQAQQAQGITDSPEQFARDIQAKAHGNAAPHLVQAYASAVGPALDALAGKHGLQFEVLQGFLYPGHSVERMHAVPERTGAALMTRLQRATDAAGIAVMTEALVRELWVGEGGQVIGLGYRRPDGTVERLACRAVLLACNGFGGNPELVRELLPEMASATFAGHVGNDGSAIAWGRELGAQLADLGGYQGHGSWAMPQGVLISWALLTEGGIQVNREGRRFHDETQGYSEAAVQVLAQPGGVAWDVFDGALLAFAQQFPDFREAQAVGAVRTAQDTAALASLIGCDAGGLRATLEKVREGAVAPDGRRFKRALTPPYHAVKVTGALFHTQGGLAIDAQCRVLQRGGTPWPNLLAAGGAARGVSGNAVWGYLSGNGLLSAVAGGAIAAQTAAQWVSTEAA